MKTELLSTNQRENATLTMSSREIARITESRHRDVCLSIRNLMNKGVIGGMRKVRTPMSKMGKSITSIILINVILM